MKIKEPTNIDEAAGTEGFGPKFRVIPNNKQVKALQTIIRDK